MLKADKKTSAREIRCFFKGHIGTTNAVIVRLFKGIFRLGLYFKP